MLEPGWRDTTLTCEDRAGRLIDRICQEQGIARGAADVTFGQWRPDERGHLVGDSGAAGSGGVF